jgi:ABC-2 type transport system ATP-binding protein
MDGMTTLDVRDLSRRYGEIVALSDVSFTVGPGQMLGLVGPNGAGKTTAMRIILGLLEPDAGEVRWGGRLADAAIRRRFGYMPEERGLYPKMRVRDQLVHLAKLSGVDRRAAPPAVDRLFSQLGISDRARDRVEQLSLGNQQRVQLAAALAGDPVLLVLDEPFSGVDPIGVDTLADVLRRRVDAGVPVVFSSHQLELVERLCDAVVILNGGRVAVSGRVDELRARHTTRAYRVAISGGGEWTAGLPGVAVLHRPDRDGGAWLLQLADGADDQALLDTARAAGRVIEFGTVTPTLAEVFRSTIQNARTERAEVPA